jgi:hypothetical protein
MLTTVGPSSLATRTKASWTLSAVASLLDTSAFARGKNSCLTLKANAKQIPAPKNNFFTRKKLFFAAIFIPSFNEQMIYGAFISFAAT